MKIRPLTLCLALAAWPALAQEPGEAAAAKRATMLQSLQRGKEIAVGGERYRHLPEVLAIEGGGAAAPGEVLERKGRLVLYRAQTPGAPRVQRVGAALAYPAVLNTRTGGLGVLTGTLIVKPKNMADADAIARKQGLENLKAYPQLGLVFYRAKPGADITDASAALQADSRVESAYPEIVERVRVPR